MLTNIYLLLLIPGLLSKTLHKTHDENANHNNPFHSKRIKRDFMFASEGVITNKTSVAECFQSCNNVWKQDFEKKLQMNVSEFYEFPFHPKILDYPTFLTYCELTDQQTECYINKSNFLCRFKRNHFVKARPCLEESEPLTFLKCDQQCHLNAIKFVEKKQKAKEKTKHLSEIENYETELNILCTFQECYKQCHEPILSKQTDLALELVSIFINWHAVDIHNWHLLTENISQLPESCSRLGSIPLTTTIQTIGIAKNETKKNEEDPILEIIENAFT